MGKITIECEVGKVSDGYHTFDELYEHRCALFVALMKSNPKISWASSLHSDGTMYDGWFIAGMNIPTGTITYHLPIKMWSALPDKETGFRCLDKAPEFDGCTSAGVLKRILDWL